MAVASAVLNPGTLLTASSVPMVTGAAGGQTVITRAVIANTSTAVAVSFTLTRTPSAGSPLTLVPTRSIPISGTDLVPELAGMVLNSGDEISASAGTVSVLNFFASGYTVIGS